MTESTPVTEPTVADKRKVLGDALTAGKTQVVVASRGKLSAAAEAEYARLAGN